MYRGALLLVIAVGALIGWSLPTGRPVHAVQAAAVVGPRPVKATRHPDPPPLGTILDRDPSGHFLVDAEINGQPVHFVVDTGATVVALTAADAQRIGIPFDRAQFNVVGSGASGPINGQPVNISSIRIGGTAASDIPGVVLGDGLPVSLLGQSFLSRIHSVSINGDRMTLR